MADKSRPTPPPPTVPATQTKGRVEGGSPQRKLEKKIVEFKMAQKEPIAPNIILQAIEGFGKTTIGAFAPKPIIIEISGEIGYQSLYNAGLVPGCLSIQVNTWTEFMDALDTLIEENEIDYQTIVIDSLSGASELCRKHVCESNFGGDWGHGTQTGYAAFNKGDGQVSPSIWKIFDQKIGQLNQKGVIIIQLTHTKIEKFENPLGEEESRYTASIVPHFWETSKRSADIILFGKFDHTKDKNGIEQPDLPVKRFLSTEYRDAFQAKNRYNMQPRFELPSDPKESWNTLWAEIHRNVIK